MDLRFKNFQEQSQDLMHILGIHIEHTDVYNGLIPLLVCSLIPDDQVLIVNKDQTVILYNLSDDSDWKSSIDDLA